jgi:hypothetical protein
MYIQIKDDGYCDECNKKTRMRVCIGEVSKLASYAIQEDTATAFVCKQCLINALNMVKNFEEEKVFCDETEIQTR